MRLVCPNCNAQYEVEDDVIPKAGRDVQCSNCSKTWFQHPAGHPDATSVATPPERAKSVSRRIKPADAAPPPNAELAAPPESAPVSEPAAEVDPAPEAEQAAQSAAEPAEEPPVAVAFATATEPEVKAETAAQRRVLDESVVNILREEADREARARKDEATALESQEELGLAISATVAASAAHDAAEEAEGPDTAGGAKGSRRDRLPDVDQITSTLRALPDQAAQSAEEEDPYDPARRLGFRRGFVSVFVLSLSMLVIYLSAPQLAVRFPGSEQSLAAYVVNVDRGRLWLDDRVKSVSAWMQGEPQSIEN